MASLEAEVQRLQQERAVLLAHVDSLERRVVQDEVLKREVAHRDDRLRSAGDEIERLRSAEQLASMQVQRYANLAQDVPYVVRVQHRTVEAPHELPAQSGGLGWSWSSLLEQESIARQAVLVEALFEPLVIALEAGIFWLRELTRLQPPTATEAFSTETAATSGHSPQQLMHEVLVARGDAEVQRQKVIFINMQLERTERLLASERLRGAQLSDLHARQLEQLTAQVARERQHVMDRLVPDVEQQLRHAYREGRIDERNRRRERRESRKKMCRGLAISNDKGCPPPEVCQGGTSQPSTVPSEDGSRSDPLL
jgi:hypothetical protein